VTTATNPRTVPVGTPQLTFGMHDGTLSDLPQGSALGRLTAPERYEAVRDAGFVLMQGADDELALRAGLERAGMGRILHPAEVLPLARRGRELGYHSITLHVGTGFENDNHADALVEAILEASEAHAIPLFIETHRATITQDPYRALRLVERHPTMRFTGDFSHWYTGVEMVYGDLSAKLDLLEPIFERVRFLHGRIGTPGSIQVDIGDGKALPFVADFYEIWFRVFEAFLRNAADGEQIVFVPELLSPRIYYALTVRTSGGEFVEAGDRWEQAFVLCDLAAEAYANAERLLPASHERHPQHVGQP
jgi:hypothetical protein